MTDPSANLTVSVEDGTDVAVLTAAGELDYFTAPLFSTRVTELVDLGRPTSVLDLTGVGFCDSVGLSVLIQAKRRADRAGTALAVRGLQPAVHRALTITGLDAMLPLDDSPGELTSRSGGPR